MMKAAVVTADSLALPAADAPLIVEAFEAEGFSVETPPWSCQETAWEEFDLVLVGSAWDYHTRVDEFLAWADRVNNATTVLNSPSFLHWNARKTYLNQLAGAGIHVVPNLKVGPDSRYNLARLSRYLDCEQLVMKPVVGAGASGIVRLEVGQEELFEATKATGEFLVQPFISAIYDGEVSLTMIDGKMSHAVRKIARDGDFRVQEEHGGSIVAHEASDAEQELAGIAMWVLPSAPLYARVDMIAFKGRPALMELELIEPDLHLRHSAESAQALAASAKARLESKQP